MTAPAIATAASELNANERHALPLAAMLAQPDPFTDVDGGRLREEEAEGGPPGYVAVVPCSLFVASPFPPSHVPRSTPPGSRLPPLNLQTIGSRRSAVC